MCIPCAAPAADILWPLLAAALFLTGALIYGLATCLPKFAVAFLLIGTGIYRFFSGAVLTKSLGEKEAAYWARSRKAPKVQRQVRAVARTAVVASAVALWINPVAVAVILGTAVVGTAGTAVYIHRDAIRAKVSPAVEGPIRVKAQIGQQ